MSVTVSHPDYDDHADEWRMLRDCERGEKWVKEAGELYLPKPEGFTVAARGDAMYTSYVTRAQYPAILDPTLDGMVGLIHRVPSEIKMPDAMTPLIEKCTKDGMTLDQFSRSLTREILLMGRTCVLTDASADGSLDLPFLALYKAEHLINWSPRDRSLFVLDESTRVLMDGFEWDAQTQYRVLRWDESLGYVQEIYSFDDPVDTTRQSTGGVTTQIGDQGGEFELIQPRAAAGKPLSAVPFVVIGPRDLRVDPEESPLMGVAKSSLAIYRLDADYRYQLYMTGQETLTITGVDAEEIPKVIGAGVILGLPKDSKAEYVSPKGTGIAAHKIAIDDERNNAVAMGVKLFDSIPRGTESGEALRIRLGSKTATLTTVAMASAAGLEKALRFAAEFMGLNPEDVTVTPNLKFADTVMSPTDAMQIVKMWQSGAISYLTLYENLRRGEIATTERDAEEERAEIDKEMPDLPPLSAVASPVVNPNGPQPAPAAGAGAAPAAAGGGNGGAFGG